MTRIPHILTQRIPILLIWYHNAGMSPRAGDWRFSVATMSMSPGYFYRKQKENRTKSTSLLYNSPPTNHIYPATWNVNNSHVQCPPPHLMPVSTVQSGAEMIQSGINIVFMGRKGDIFVISSSLKSHITVEPHYYGHQGTKKIGRNNKVTVLARVSLQENVWMLLPGSQEKLVIITSWLY